jgi:hypothetical protein
VGARGVWALRPACTPLLGRVPCPGSIWPLSVIDGSVSSTSRVALARIGEYVGQRDLSVTAKTYSHVILDEAEVDYDALLAV